ncbi:hypothetical protein [Natronococcus sp. A-GB7]|uniref:hypothetical protein n=1 Tax=Natronococcus sp. A-GB7 TaxID=3037649 RepID=UPI00241F0816|nr:hypothetical protein [Natronococcus sp. A-GB7]MDG5821860.1 hypothetical protein [Natronococcus sp. A-GB7]
MSTWLPLKYNLLLFLASALLLPVLGMIIGSPFANPTVTGLLVIPAAVVLGGNLGYYVQTQKGTSGVVDERDVQNIDLAFTGTGITLLVSIVVIYTGYAATDSVAPTELDYLALIAIMTVFVILGGTEIHQRL